MCYKFLLILFNFNSLRLILFNFNSLRGYSTIRSVQNNNFPEKAKMQLFKDGSIRSDSVVSRKKSKANSWHFFQATIKTENIKLGVFVVTPQL